jgi:carboxyl-terminal processing protease
MRASRPALAMSIVGVALMGATMSVAEDRSADDHPVMVGSRPTAAVHGVWRSRGYGYVVRIGQDGLKLFHTAGDFCYADQRGERDPDGLFEYYRSIGPDTVAFSTMPGQTQYVFDRVSGLPRACTERTQWTAPRIAALFAETFADLYPSFELRGIDWKARTAAALSTLTDKSNDAALFKALQGMLAGLEDPHVELTAKVAGAERTLELGDGPTLSRVRAGGNGGPVLASSTGAGRVSEEKWRESYERGILRTVLQGKGHLTANDRVLWGRVGDIGYINFLSIAGFTESGSDNRTVIDAVLDQAMAAFSGARAVIVDVSSNRGGYDGLGQHIAGRFADTRRLAYTKVAHGAQGVEPQPFYVEPSKRARYLGPVYLLTSDVTLSAGEVFALYMRALPNVIQVGGNTRGAFSDMIEKPLPNGWTLSLSAEVYRDPQGQSYEARGLPPQRQFEVFPADDLTGGHARRVLSLMDEIRREAPNGTVGGSRPATGQ